jgi:hypothetical protein
VIGDFLVTATSEADYDAFIATYFDGKLLEEDRMGHAVTIVTNPADPNDLTAITDSWYHVNVVMDYDDIAAVDASWKWQKRNVKGVERRYWGKDGKAGFCQPGDIASPKRAWARSQTYLDPSSGEEVVLGTTIGVPTQQL